MDFARLEKRARDIVCYRVDVTPRFARSVLIVSSIVSVVLLFEMWGASLSATTPPPSAGALSASSLGVKSTNAVKKKKGPAVPHAFPVPAQCAVDPRKRIDGNDDSFCYKAQADVVLKDLAENVGQRAALCWPKPGVLRKAPPAAAAPAAPPASCAATPAVFHTLADAEGNLGLLISSFLATQCCSSELWVWASPHADAVSLLEGLDVPPQHAGRIRVQRLSAAGPDTPLGLVAKHGGTFLSPDTFLLRDFSPLLADGKAFFVRWTGSEMVALGVVHIPCGSPLVANDLLGLTDKARLAPPALFATLKSLAGVPDHAALFTLYSATLFDPVWMRQDNVEAASAKPANAGVRCFDDMFRPGKDPVLFDAAEAAGTPFFPGSFAICWHGRAAAPPPKETWAAQISARAARDAAEKQCVAAPK